MTLTLPAFQAQNPAISGYALGWESCQAFAGAMAAAFDHQTKLIMTGGQLREATGDHSGGLTLAQVDAALERKWPTVSFQVRYRLDWPTFERMIDAGFGASLSVWYAPIADSRFDAGRGFRRNHQVFVPPGWAAMDPLADGRYGEAYRYRGEPYPRALLREAAGKLNLATSGYLPLGTGLVYAGFTRDRLLDYRLRFAGRQAFWVYRVKAGRITGRYSKRFSADTGARCTTGARFPWPAKSTSRILVRMLNGALKGQYVAIPQSALKLEVI